MWAASCLASCCAACACDACRTVVSGISRRSARIAYCGLFAFSLVVAWILREVAAPLMESLPCKSSLLQFHFSFSLFFLFGSIVLCSIIDLFYGFFVFSCWTHKNGGKLWINLTVIQDEYLFLLSESAISAESSNFLYFIPLCFSISLIFLVSFLGFE